ncbi:hypothetical protein A7D23_06040 [Dehalobacter sp. TeCB1]|nr:hypothetical protein A7D23_06040 [Dehalobacter sp. TeCB1]
MTGIPEYNFPAFNQAADYLRRSGYEVINPAEFGDPLLSWEANMRRAIRGMMKADRVVVLEGWEKSRGARIEVELAEKLDIPVVNMFEKAVNG